MKTGHVKWFNDKKGYGFIQSGDKEYFVYFKDIMCDGYKTLSEGDNVKFHYETSEKGCRAKNVVKVDSGYIHGSSERQSCN